MNLSSISPPVALIDDESLDLFLTASDAVLILICSFGMITNVLNMLVFATQGLSDSTNISLMALALSDFLSLLTLLWRCLSYELVKSPDFSVPFAQPDVAYLTGGWPHVCFTRITSFLTAFITFERCLCVSLPLKVKDILTPRRTLIVALVLYLLGVVVVAPIYFTASLGWRFFPKLNASLLAIEFTTQRNVIDQVSITINNVILPVTAFWVVVGCTATLVIKLKEKKKWRTQSTRSTAISSVSDKEKRVSKLVLLVATVYIVCNVPGVIFFLAYVFLPAFRVKAVYKNLNVVCMGSVFFLEAINSSANIFVYYAMSTKFKDQILKIAAQVCLRRLFRNFIAAGETSNSSYPSICHPMRAE